MRTIHNLKNRKLYRKILRKAATPQEVILWSRLRKNQLGYQFRRQHSIGFYIVDFYCAKKKLIIEIDGSQHIEKQKEHDKERDKYLENLGFTVLRFWDSEINNNLNGALMKIKEHLEK